MDAAAEKEVQRGEGLVDAREHRARREGAVLQRVEQRLELRGREQVARLSPSTVTARSMCRWSERAASAAR